MDVKQAVDRDLLHEGYRLGGCRVLGVEREVLRRRDTPDLVGVALTHRVDAGRVAAEHRDRGGHTTGANVSMPASAAAVVASGMRWLLQRMAS